MDLTYCPKIRLFRWNEKLVDKKNMLQDYSQGLCLFDIIDTTVYRTHRPDSRNSEIRKSLDRRCDCVTTSDLGRLLSAAEDDDDDQDRLSELITELVTGTALFSPETAAELGIQISTHFTNDYQLRKSNKGFFGSSIWGARFVMVLQIRVFRWFECIGTETQLSPVFYSVTCKGNHHHHEDEDSDKEDEECTEEWAQDDVRWYDYSDEAVAYWIRLRNYLGEPKHDNLLTRAIIRDEPRGLWEIPPTSLVPHRQRGNDDCKELELGIEDDFCSICLNGSRLIFWITLSEQFAAMFSTEPAFGIGCTESILSLFVADGYLCWLQI